jgi:hypothetical protein
MVNAIYSEQSAAFGTPAKWQARPGTISVTKATLQTDTNDVTKALALMCNNVENCSVPAGKFEARLGTDARYPGNNLDVSYRCLGEATDRTASFRWGQDAVLACNLRRAIAGVYVNTSHDATPEGRLSDDTVIVSGLDRTSTDGRQIWWSWTPETSSKPAFEVFNVAGLTTTLSTISEDTFAIEWGEEGHPVRLKNAYEKTSFEWISAGVASLPVVPSAQ